MPPIKPSEVKKLKAQQIPEIVFQSFNELIIKNYTGGSATINQKDVVNLILSKMFHAGDPTDNMLDTLRNQIYENHWLDIEDIYRASGWRVEYDKADWNTGGPSFFKFSKA